MLYPASSELTDKFRALCKKINEKTDTYAEDDTWLQDCLKSPEQTIWIGDIEFNYDAAQMLIGVGFDLGQTNAPSGIVCLTNDKHPDYVLFMIGSEDEILKRLEQEAADWIEANPKDMDD
jgi:hypothetical protein